MGTKLLLADDSITIQKVVGIIFANEDFDLTVVDNGVSALEKAREQMPDLMLVDALMPGKNGYEVCQEIRSDASLKNTPLLLMIGAFEPFDEDKAHQCGADDVISKPFESQQLVEKVKALLDLGMQRSPEKPAPVEPAAPVVPETTAAAESWGTAALEPAAGFETASSADTGFFDEPLMTAEFVSPGDIQLTSSESAGFELDVVEAAPSDDPWGVFDLTDMDEEPSLVSEEPADIVEYVSEPLVTLKDEPSDSALEESGPVFLDSSELPEKELSAGFQEPVGRWEPVEEEGFAFQNEEPTPAGETFAVGMGEPLAMLSQEPDVFVEPSVPFIPPVEMPLPVAEEEPAPVVTQPVQPAPTAAPAAIGEEQLRAILAQLSREVIEKIVWEVVPDLAENLIKEEIRRLKAGLRDQ